MDLVFDIASSMQFWRTRYPESYALKPSESSPPEHPTAISSEVWRLAPTWVDGFFLEPIGGKFHIMSFDRNMRKQTTDMVVHTWSQNLAKGSFYELKPHVHIAAPEFIFLASANILGMRQLIALGDELCGLYGFDMHAERGLRKREVPLTNKKRMSEYLSRASDCRGAAKALQALRFVVERSGSPMETFDVMAICLPCHLGGYALRQPEMNRSIKLSPAARTIYHAKECAPDLGWFDIGLAVEHLGEYDHSGAEKALSDRARVNALKEMDFHVIELTGTQVYDLDAFETIILMIAKMLGKRVYKRDCGATDARLALHREIKAWNKSYGNIRNT